MQYIYKYIPHIEAIGNGLSSKLQMYKICIVYLLFKLNGHEYRFRHYGNPLFADISRVGQPLFC